MIEEINKLVEKYFGGEENKLKRLDAQLLAIDAFQMGMEEAKKILVK